jgi:hypothetical protein
VAVVWNLEEAAFLSLPLPVDELEAFDLMGNPLPVEAVGNRAGVRLLADRPTYLRARSGEAGLLERALAGAEVREVAPIAVVARTVAAGSTEVLVTNWSRSPQDGVIDLPSPAGVASEERVVSAHFQSLAPDETRRFRLESTGAAAARSVRVRVGDREMREVTAQIAGG